MGGAVCQREKALSMIFVAGMPRSGSTLLMNLLGQNPANHVTSTNDLVDMVMRIRDSWMGAQGFVAQGLATVQPRILAGCRGLVEGFYAQEFADGRTVFDKSRGWLAKIELVEELLGRPIKILVTVRDIRDILASFEKIYRKSSMTDHPYPVEDAIKRYTVEGRCALLLEPHHTLGFALLSLHDACVRGLADRVIIVRYKALTHKPVQTISHIHTALGLPEFVCDPLHVEQLTQEDDTVWGMDLHAVRPVVEPDRGHSWHGILPKGLASNLDSYYAQYQALVAGQPLTSPMVFGEI